MTCYPNAVVYEVDLDVDNDLLTDLASFQISWSEIAYKYRKISAKLRAGYKTDKAPVLNGLWLDTQSYCQVNPDCIAAEAWWNAQGSKLGTRLKEIENYLSSKDITGLWHPEDSPTDDGGKPRDFESWSWTPPVSEPAKAEPRLRSRAMTITPAEARVIAPKPPYVAGLLDAQEISRVLAEKEPTSSPAAIVQTVERRTSLVDQAMNERGLT